MSFKFKTSWFKWLLKLSLGGVVLILLFWFSVYFGLWGRLPSKEDISNIKQAEASVLLDVNEELLGKYFIFDRQIVAYKDLPKHMVDALVAANKEFDLFIYPNKNHGIYGGTTRLHLFNKMTDFILENL